MIEKIVSDKAIKQVVDFDKKLNSSVKKVERLTIKLREMAIELKELQETIRSFTLK